MELTLLHFIALTFVIIVAIVLMSPTPAIAATLIGVATSVLIISTQLHYYYRSSRGESTIPPTASAMVSRAVPAPLEEDAPLEKDAPLEEDAPTGAGWPGAIDADAPATLLDREYAAAIPADEQFVHQARSRNDATRVLASALCRQQHLDPYLREEPEEAERAIWWGNSEH